MESAKVDGRLLRPDSEIPVNATVTLEVGSAPIAEEEMSPETPVEEYGVPDDVIDDQSNAIFD